MVKHVRLQNRPRPGAEHVPPVPLPYAGSRAGEVTDVGGNAATYPDVTTIYHQQDANYAAFVTSRQYSHLQDVFLTICSLYTAHGLTGFLHRWFSGLQTTQHNLGNARTLGQEPRKHSF